ncbi:MAG: EamA family transporter [Actinomycetota bacterium]
MKTVVMTIFSVVVATSGQLLLRAGMENVGRIGGEQLREPVDLALTVLRTPQVLFGLALFALSAVSWMIVLSRVPLSFAYPFVGLTYVLTTVFAKFVLHEHVPVMRWLALGLIITGVILVGTTSAPGKQGSGRAPARVAHQSP